MQRRRHEDRPPHDTRTMLLQAPNNISNRNKQGYKLIVIRIIPVKIIVVMIVRLISIVIVVAIRIGKIIIVIVILIVMIIIKHE